MGTAYQTVHVALGALQGDEFRGEVVAMHGPLAAVADRTQLPLITAAEEAHGARIVALECNKSQTVREASCSFALWLTGWIVEGFVKHA